jgi:Ni,Fe-hydrogenase III large subunit/Ni,Fe-hydrogenase III component G
MNPPSYYLVQEIGCHWGISIYRPGQTQLQFLINVSENLRRCCLELQKLGCYLVTIVANDERELEDHCFKIYHLFSHPTDNVFVTLELNVIEGHETYPSISDIFPAAEVFECEIADLLGLLPEGGASRPLRQFYLHNNYPEGMHPLRRNWNSETFQNILKGASSAPTEMPYTSAVPEGELYIPVGPVHAGVIEPGNFLFRISGEPIEQLDILLGYTHKGIERLYQSNFTILEGYQLAEKVSGDTSFAHNLAYCKAVENLARISIPSETSLLRAIFLELERSLNHITDCGALVHDLALEVPASDMAVLRERLMRLCGSLTHSRFLCGINRPGGICLPKPFDERQVVLTLRSVIQKFLDLANLLILRSDFRERTINTGILPTKIALRLGITGLAARASGISRDFRIQHPFGPYHESEIQDLIQKGAERIDLPIKRPCVMTGDVFSRFIQRVIEVDISGRLIEKFIEMWGKRTRTDFIEPLELHKVPNYEIGIGYVEGWRGDIIYWLMKDKFDHIFRCKVRDPSMLNWAGLREAVASSSRFENQPTETALADFPVINKSFNLSYSGVDL